MNTTNLRELLGKTFDCECGRTHEIATKSIVYSKDALERMPDILCSSVDGRNVVLVADKRTWTIAGERARRILEENRWFADHVIIPDTDHGGPVCDDTTLARLDNRTPRCDIALAVGCGVVNDLTKWLAFNHKMPYAGFATAATMNAFTAANVAPTIAGLKTILSARAPVAVFAVPSIITDAPFELTAAGLGDTIAKPVSTADWILNHIFGREYFCRYCSEMLNALEPCYFDRPDDIKNRRPAAIEALFNALLYSGIAMTIVGTSAPASGGEHLLSHTLDMTSGIDGTAHDLHGRQVGLGTLFASALYDRVLGIDKCRSHTPPADIDSVFWGRLAGNVRQQYEQKMPMLQALRRKVGDGETWQRFLAACRPRIRPPGQIKDCLKTAGAAHTFADIGCSRQRLHAAVLHMHEIRKRTTIVDLAWILGILPEAADDIIDRWLTA